MSYSSVGAQPQNRKVEKLFCDVQDQGRIVLLHTKHRWPDANGTPMAI